MLSIDSQKPATDKKNYKLITLASGLEAVLVSTKYLTLVNDEDDTQRAAAAMCVEVGSFADPSDCEGMTRRTTPGITEMLLIFQSLKFQHMIFMGSVKYPTENHYDSFVTAHGGSCNAMTEGEYTAFEFDVSAEYFKQALDIFAHCLLSPLLSQDCSDREINAIESEFNLARNDDSVRLQQLHCHMASHGHLLRKFTWGNALSLKVKPQMNGIDVNRLLYEFWRAYYLPQNMKLVVVAPYSLDDLESFVMESFGGSYAAQGRQSADMKKKISKVDSKKPKLVSSKKQSVELPMLKKTKLDSKLSRMVVPPTAESEAPSMFKPFGAILSAVLGTMPWNSASLSKVSRVVPVKNMHRLSLSWVLEPLQHDYRAKSRLYVSHLLGHEGPGSLLSALKGAMLGTGVCAGVSDDNLSDNSMFSLFNVTVTLTELGLANWTEVARAVYAYLGLLNREGPQRWIFEEMQRTAELAYDNLDEEDESEFAERLAVSMRSSLRRPPVELLPAPFLLWDWDPAAISRILSCMTPRNGKVFVMSSAYGASSELMEASDSVDNDDDDEDGGTTRNGSLKAPVNGSGEGGEDEDDKDDEGDWEDEEDDDDDDDEEEDGDEGGVESRVGRAAAAAPLSAAAIRDLYAGPTRWLYLSLPPAALVSDPAAGLDLAPQTTPHGGKITVPTGDTLNHICGGSGSGNVVLDGTEGGADEEIEVEGSDCFHGKDADTGPAANHARGASRIPLTEPHFGTLYWDDEMPAALLDLWTATYENSSDDISSSSSSSIGNNAGKNGSTAGEGSGGDSVAIEATPGEIRPDSVLTHHALFEIEKLSMPPRNLYIPTTESMALISELVAAHAKYEAMAAAAAATAPPSVSAVKVSGKINKALRGKREESSAVGSLGGVTSYGDAREESELSPRQVLNEDGISVWHMVDPRFPLPKVAIYIRLCSPVAIPPRTQAVAGESESKESGNRPTSAGAFESDRVAAAVLHDLLTRLLTDALGEEAYMAAMAELELSVCNSDSAISLTVQGFGDKAFLLAKTALKLLCDPLELVEPPSGGGGMLQRQLEELLRRYSNDSLKAHHAASNARLLVLKPSRVAAEAKLSFLKQQEPQPTIDEVGSTNSPATIVSAVPETEAAVADSTGLPSQKLLGAVTKEMMIAYVTQFLSECCADILVEGNATQADAIELAETLKSLLISAFSLKASTQLTLATTGFDSSSSSSSSSLVDQICAKYSEDGSSNCSNSSSSSSNGSGISTDTISKILNFAETESGHRRNLGLAAAAKPREPIVMLPSGLKPIVLSVLPRNKDEKNICVEMYFQCPSGEGRMPGGSAGGGSTSDVDTATGEWKGKRSKDGLVSTVTHLDLLEQLIIEPFFDSIRTKKQLGYSVSCSSRLSWDVPGFTFTVVSASHSVQEVQVAVVDFIKNIPKLISAMKRAVFQENLQALIRIKLKPPTSLFDAASSHWSEIEDGRNHFAFQRDQAILLQSGMLTRESMAEFAEHVMMSDARRLLVLEASHSPELPNNSDCVRVRSIEMIHSLCKI